MTEHTTSTIKKLLFILQKNLFPSHILLRIKIVRQYITTTHTLSNIPASPPSNSTHFFKLAYFSPYMPLELRLNVVYKFT